MSNFVQEAEQTCLNEDHNHLPMRMILYVTAVMDAVRLDISHFHFRIILHIKPTVIESGNNTNSCKPILTYQYHHHFSILVLVLYEAQKEVQQLSSHISYD